MTKQAIDLYRTFDKASRWMKKAADPSIKQVQFDELVKELDRVWGLLSNAQQVYALKALVKEGYDLGDLLAASEQFGSRVTSFDCKDVGIRVETIQTISRMEVYQCNAR